MNQSLYNNIFARMDELESIRKDLSFGCEIKIDGEKCKMIDESLFDKGPNVSFWRFGNMTQNGIDIDYEKLGHPPILSDVLVAELKVRELKNFYNEYEGDCPISMMGWDYSKPFLKDQSDELGTKLLSLLSTNSK